jgi:hypothetical protein
MNTIGLPARLEEPGGPAGPQVVFAVDEPVLTPCAAAVLLRILRRHAARPEKPNTPGQPPDRAEGIAG